MERKIAESYDLRKPIDEQLQTPKVTVIVPVYNVEAYLERCLGSLQNQTLKDIEIILIDDGSKDFSGHICDLFASKDSRFKVIHKNNEGLSAARNDGIDFSLSDYIMFVDSDDWVEPDFCEVPYNVAKETGADLIIFQFSRCGKKSIRKQKPFPKIGVTSKKDVLTWLWCLTGEAAWNKMYQKKLFDGVRYPVGRLCEDNAITHRLIYNAKCIFLLNKNLYFYREYRPDSITNHRSYKLVEDYIYFNLRRIDDLKKWGYAYKGEEKRIALWYLVTMGRKAELSDRFDKVLKNNKSFSKNTPQRYKVMYWLYCFLPSFFDLISFLSKKRVR